MQLITVNHAINNLEALNGEYLYIEGLLTFEFENTSINHWTKIEHHYNSSIWLDVGGGAFSFNEPLLSSWSGQRIVVGGTLHKPDFGGAGHFDLWPASILVTYIELLTEWQRKI